ncbi:MAG: HNH endonuclease [Treponema sp.]|nr:HNH endonuclease [Treponema sp.]
MRAKICKEPGCNILIQPDKTYCDKHIKEKKMPFENAVRNNALLYNTTAWKKLRAQKIKEQSFCSKCGINKNLSVHHKLPPLGDSAIFYDYNNLDVLCDKCHRIETNREILNRNIFTFSG